MRYVMEQNFQKEYFYNIWDTFEIEFDGTTNNPTFTLSSPSSSVRVCSWRCNGEKENMVMITWYN